jgi:hypothetical protein
MLKLFSLLIFTATLCANGLAQELIHPVTIRQCLKNKKAFALRVLTSNNPYYLRGDLDAATPLAKDAMLRIILSGEETLRLNSSVLL